MIDDKNPTLPAMLRAAWERPLATAYDPRYLLLLAAERLEQMPTVTMTFNLPDEQGDYDAARLGSKMAVALWQIEQRCRGLLKHGDPSEETRQLAEEIRDMIRNICPDALEL